MKEPEVTAGGRVIYDPVAVWNEARKRRSPMSEKLPTPEDIAYEVIRPHFPGGIPGERAVAAVAAYARQVAEAQREADACICDEVVGPNGTGGVTPQWIRTHPAARACAERIRATPLVTEGNNV